MNTTKHEHNFIEFQEKQNSEIKKLENYISEKNNEIQQLFRKQQKNSKAINDLLKNISDTEIKIKELKIKKTKLEEGIVNLEKNSNFYKGILNEEEFKEIIQKKRLDINPLTIKIKCLRNDKKILKEKYRKLTLKNKIHKKFIESLEPFKYLKNKNNFDNIVLAKISNEELLTDENGKPSVIVVSLSLMTINMLLIDTQYFDVENIENKFLKDVYKPYYYGMTFFVEKNIEKNSPKSNGYDKLRALSEQSELGYNWFILEIEKNDLYGTYIDSGGNEDKQYEKITEKKNKLYEIDGYLADGFLEFIGSSHKVESGTLLEPKKTTQDYIKSVNNYLNDKINKLEKIDKISKVSLDINKELNKRIKNVLAKPAKLKVFNIGQASYNSITYNSYIHPTIIFDCGIPNIWCTDKNNNNKTKFNRDLIPHTTIWNLIQNLPKLQPNIAIISHWHEDHFKGFFSMEKENIDKCYWIAPKPENGEYTENVKRLFNYLCKNGLISYVEKSEAGKQIANINDEMVLYRGYIDTKHPNNINAHSLILLVKNKLLLPGDSKYAFWPLVIPTDKITILIAPHHGSDSALYGFKNKNFNQNIKKIAFTSSGKSGYNPEHPGISHVTNLKNDNFNVYQTNKIANNKFFYEINI